MVFIQFIISDQGDVVLVLFKIVESRGNLVSYSCVPHNAGKDKHYTFKLKKSIVHVIRTCWSCDL